MERYAINTVPSEKEVLYNPLTLFINSILVEDEHTLSLLNKDTYRSYIAAVGKFATSLQSFADVRIAARAIRLLIQQQNIRLSAEEDALLCICCSLNDASFESTSELEKAFKAFSATV